MCISEFSRKIMRMPRRTRLPVLLAALALLGCTAPALAAQPPSPELGQGSWWMGLGYLRYQRPYAGSSHWNRFVPLFSIDTRHFYVHGLTFGWRAWRRGANSLELVAHPDALHYNAADNAALAGMTTKLASVMGGPAWVWRFRRHLLLRTQALTDLLGRNHGQILSLALAGHWRAGQWFFRPRAALEWYSSNYVNYYFGVTSAEAQPGRPAYTGPATWSESVGVSVGRTFARHFAALVGAYATHFGSGVTASPIVARTSTTSLLLAIYYRF